MSTPFLSPRILRTAFAFLACLAALLVVYRVQILSFGNRLPGDVVDARIAITLGEHWFNVARGLETWNQPLYFAPTQDVLGYNDGYLIYGVFFSVFRFCGVDPFLAGEFAGATFRVIGFAGLLAFARRTCRLPYGWALVAATVATVSNAAYLQAPHVQLLTVGLAPVLATLLGLAWEDDRRNAAGRAVLWSCLAAFLFDAWLLTAFYTAWFTALFAALATTAAVALRPAACWAGVRGVHVGRFLPAAALLIAGMTPFARVYLPKASETGMHPFAEAFSYTPSLLDLVHVGAGNVLFGWLDAWLTAALRPGFPNLGEHTVGFPPLLLGLALLGAALAFARNPAGRSAWLRPLAVAFVLSLLLCLHAGSFSLWGWVYQAVPGAAAVRVVSRFLLLLDPVAAVLAAYVLAEAARRWRPTVPLLLACALIAEEATADGIFALDRGVETRFVASIPPPPRDCAAFYIQVPRTIFAPNGSVEYQPLSVNVDGMLLAELLHLPTPNGHASFLPAGFGMGFHDPASYADSAPMSILDRGIQAGMCGLDLQANRWTLADIGFAPATLGDGISFGVGGTAGRYLLRGWSGAEPNGRWTEGPAARLGMQVEPAAGDVVLTLRASAFPGLGQPSAVDVFANDEPVASWRPIPALQSLQATIPRRVIAADGIVRIRLAILHPMSPLNAGQGADPRPLGLFVEQLRLTQGPRQRLGVD